MGSAPKQELMINLACLSHPPQTQTTDRHFVQEADMNMSMMHMIKAMWDAPAVSRHHLDAVYADNEAEESYSVDDFVGLAMSTNQTEPPVLPPLTPADKWMIELQKRIAEDRARRDEARRRPARGDKDPRPQDGSDDGLPDGEVPHRPVGGDHRDGENGPHDEDRGDRNSGDRDTHGGPRDAPRPPIDPRLCKRSPNTQAAAATLTMSTFIR